jgi:hypothetical protein
VGNFLFFFVLLAVIVVFGIILYLFQDYLLWQVDRYVVIIQIIQFYSYRTDDSRYGYN